MSQNWTTYCTSIYGHHLGKFFFVEMLIAPAILVQNLSDTRTQCLMAIHPIWCTVLFCTELHAGLDLTCDSNMFMISNMCDMINMGDYTSLKLGQIFSSFEKVKAAISRYEKRNYVNLYVNNSRTISSTIKRTPSKVIKAKLQYSHINYACIAGGRTFKSKSKGTRTNQRIVFL